MSDSETSERKLSGRMVLLICVAFFGTLMSVNFFMAYQAVSTFPGVEVSSSYADSQDFNIRRDAQDALGWTATVEPDPENGILVLHLTDSRGYPAAPVRFEALLTRPTTQTDDQLLELRRDSGSFVAEADLSPGRWRLRMTGEAADGTAYRHNLTFSIRE